MPQLDRNALQIIAARNGLGLSKTASKQLTPEDKQLLANMRTNRQARAVLGVIAQYLRRAYEIANGVGGDLSTAMKSRLDSTNNYAQKAYNAIPDDDGPLTPLNRKRVEESLREARVGLSEISADAEDMNRGLTGALVDLLVSKLPPWAQNALNPHKGSMDKVLLVAGIGAAVIGIFIAVRLAMKITLGGADLAAAEEEAMQIADAARRKRHSRSAFSLS